ncbi:hypothetical protein [Mycobacterium colombiense]|uniref:hypothetical protein n=1 Tax=Mycobacterium colombiense TaxID=339268 RepID=UPI001E51EEC9|nr:hypothetical protein [Mycobacterium colombiense]
MAGRFGVALPQSGPTVSGCHGARAAPHRGISSNLGGANAKVVQRLLGHESAAMTLVVSAELFDSDLSAAAEKLDEIMGKMWAKPALQST